MSKNNLKLLVFAIFIVVSVLAIVMLAKLNVRNVEKTVVSRTQEHLVTIAESQARRIEASLEEIEQGFNIIARANYCERLLGERPGGESTEGQNDSLDNIIYQHMKDSISKLYRLDGNGVVENVIPYDKYEIGINYSQRADIAATIRSGHKVKMKVPNCYQSEDVFSICQPVYKNNKPYKIYKAEISRQKIHNIVKDIKAGNHGYAWILDEQGVIISHPNPNYIGKHYMYIIQKAVKDDEARLKSIMEKMISGERGAGLYDFVIWKDNSYKPIIKLTAYEPVDIAGEKCSIAICMGYDEISGPIKAHSRHILTAFIVLMSIFLITGILYYLNEKKQTKLQAELAISRVNEELQATTNERIEAITRLKKSEELFRGIISSVPVAIFWKDTEGRYQGCNEKFVEEAGYIDASEIIGKTDHQLKWNDYQADMFVHYDQEIIRTQLPLTNVEETIMNNEGEKRYVMMNRAPLIDPEGKVVAVVGTFMDYTNLKQVQEKAIQESIMKTKMVETLNHDIRVPMTSIIGFAELLEQEDIDDQQKEYASTICHNARELVNVIDEIISKNPEMKQFGGPTDIISDVQKEIDAKKENILSDEIREKDVSFSENVRTVEDTSKNLESGSDNKADKGACDAGGDVNSSGKKSEIGKELKSKTKQFVKKLTKQNSPAETKDIGEQIKDMDAKILLVDDVAENRMLVEAMFKKAKLNVVSKSNGKEAVESAEQEHFDVILMDINMPGMNGIEATKAIKEKSSDKLTQIIAMTAYDSKEDEIECLEAGFDDFLAKPIKKDNLFKKVYRAINHVRQIKEADEGLDITSFLENDEDYKKAVEMFVENLPDRIHKMQSAIEDNDLEQLKSTAHSLKGLGSFAGFPVYTERAKELEDTIGGEDFEKVREKVEELAKLCMRTKLRNK